MSLVSLSLLPHNILGFKMKTVQTNPANKLAWRKALLLVTRHMPKTLSDDLTQPLLDIGDGRK